MVQPYQRYATPLAPDDAYPGMGAQLPSKYVVGGYAQRQTIRATSITHVSPLHSTVCQPLHAAHPRYPRACATATRVPLVGAPGACATFA